MSAGPAIVNTAVHLRLVGYYDQVKLILVCSRASRCGKSDVESWGSRQALKIREMGMRCTSQSVARHIEGLADLEEVEDEPGSGALPHGVDEEVNDGKSPDVGVFEALIGQRLHHAGALHLHLLTCHAAQAVWDTETDTEWLQGIPCDPSQVILHRILQPGKE